MSPVETVLVHENECPMSQNASLSTISFGSLGRVLTKEPAVDDR